MLKKDCFGYSEISGGCSVLEEVVCRNGNCPFYKTNQQFLIDRYNTAFGMEKLRLYKLLYGKRGQ